MATTGVQPSYKSTAHFATVKARNTGTVNPGALTTGTQTSGTVTVTNAVVGDFVVVSAGTDLLLTQATAYVSAADTVTWVLRNGTAGTVTVTSSTWTFVVLDSQLGQGVGI
jgi:plastocyanin